jgi:UDP-GlcNAc:undecaprenyl-phosphate GlcNAc-1-phosphate transferase
VRLPWRPRAKVFLGNAGSGFLGLVIAWVAFRLTQNDGHPVNPVLALWLLPIPVMDTLVLIVRRLREGRSPFAAGRDHIHHLMQDAGFGPTRAALLLAGFSLACGLLVGQAMRMDVPHPVLLLAYVLLCAGWLWLSSDRARTIAFFRRLRRH